MSGCQHLPRTQKDRVIGNAKTRVESLAWTRVTKSGHAYEMRAVLDIAFLAKSPRRFNRDTRRGSKDILAPRHIVIILLKRHWGFFVAAPLTLAAIQLLENLQMLWQRLNDLS